MKGSGNDYHDNEYMAFADSRAVCDNHIWNHHTLDEHTIDQHILDDGKR
jgi:hypothetical protein